MILQINQVSIKSGSRVKSLITEYLGDQSSSFLAMIIREGKIKYLEGDKEGS